MKESVDQSLAGFLRAHEGHPLGVSKKHNLASQNPKHIESVATSCLQHNLSQKPVQDVENTSNSFKCLYLIPRTLEQSVNLARKHHVFTIQLLESKNVGRAIKELISIYQLLNKIIHNHSISTTSVPISDLLKLKYQEIPENPQLTTLVVAFNFLVLQALLQYLSLNIGNVIKGRDELVNWTILKSVSAIFLNNSDLSRWIRLSYRISPDNIKRYTNNRVKMLKGFIKVLDVVMKNNSHKMLATYRACMSLKLGELTGETEYFQNLSVTPEITSFIDDLRQLPQFEVAASALLNPQMQIEPINDSQCETSTESNPSDILRTIKALSAEPSSDLLTQLKLQLLHSDPQILRNNHVFDAISGFPLNNSPASFTFMQIVISYVSSSSKALRRLSSPNLLVMDRFTIHIKSIIDQHDSHKLQMDTLSHLYIIFKAFNQTKRIRNLSNLYYHLGHRSKNIHAWSISVEYELYIHSQDSSLENFDFLRLKVQKVLDIMCQNNSSEVAPILIKFLEISQAYETDESIIHLVAMCILHNDSVAETLFKSSLDDELKANLATRLFTVLGKGASTKSTNVINTIVKSLDMSKRTFSLVAYRYYDIELGEYLKIEPPNTSSPIISAGLLLQHLIHFEWSDEKLTQMIQYCNQWIEQKPNNLEQYEMDIFQLVLEYLRFNGLTGYIIYLTKQYKETSIETSFSIVVEHALCLALDRLSLEKEVLESLAHWNYLLKKLKVNSIHEVINFNLVQLKHNIETGQLDPASERFSKILKVMNSKPDFDLNSNVKLQLLDKLNNLVLIAKFQLLASRLNSALGNHHEAFNNAKVSIKLLYSVIRTRGTNIPKSLYSQIKWETTGLLFSSYTTIMKVLKRLGITRDYLYYLSELNKLNESTNIPLINCINNFELIIQNMFLENVEAANKLYLKNIELMKFSTVGNNSTVIDSMCRVTQILNRSNEELPVSPRYRSLSDIPHSELICIYTLGGIFDIDSYALRSMNNVEQTERNLGSFDYQIDELETVMRSRTTRLNSENNITAKLLLLKIRLGKSITLLSNDPNTTALDDAVKSLPSINTEGITDLSMLSTEIINQLVQYKNIMMDYINNGILGNVTVCQFKVFNKLLNQCLSLLSALTIFKQNTNLLIELYYLQDFASTLPFMNDRLLNHSSNGPTDLLPSPAKVVEKSLAFSKLSMSFNLDLNIHVPPNWSIVTIDICSSTGDFLLSKFVKGNQPFFLRLPLRKPLQTDGLDIESFIQINREFKEIIRQSDISTKSATTSKITCKEDRKNWWKLRFSLDLRMKQLLDHVETYWFGCFKGIFANYKQDVTFEKFKIDFLRLLKSVLPSRRPYGDETKFMEFDDSLIMIFYSLENYDKSQVQDLLEHVVSTLKFHGETNKPNEINSSKFHKSFEMLFDKYSNLRSRFENEHLVLIPSSKCSYFPWESLQCMKDKSISRMPSVKLLLQLLKTRANFNVSKEKDVYYVINPAGDLVRTEEKLKPKFSAKLNWSGLIGEKPKEDVFLSKLLASNLFVYSGHGGCDQYFRTSALFKKCLPDGPSLPPSLLIGCSSGALKLNGMLEPTGNIYNWLVCGAPMVLVNLWDVTDKDIDSFSLSVFEKWGLFGNLKSQKRSICEAVCQSRDVCNLIYLNGAAPIVYGLPLYLE